MERIPGPQARSVPVILPASESGDGNSCRALGVGDKGVGKPGYFLPTSVKSERCGFRAFGRGKILFNDPMLKDAAPALDCDGPPKLFVAPSSALVHDAEPARLTATVCWKQLVFKELVGLDVLLPLLESTEVPWPVIRRRA